MGVILKVFSNKVPSSRADNVTTRVARMFSRKMTRRVVKLLGMSPRTKFVLKDHLFLDPPGFFPAPE